MIVLTIHAQSSNHTVFLEKPIRNPRRVKLLSCTLQNSWHNLKEAATIFYKRPGSEDGDLTRPIRPGNYTLDSLIAAVKEAFPAKMKEKDQAVQFLPFHATGGTLIITNPFGSQVELDKPLADLLGMGGTELKLAEVTKLSSLQAYYVYCDLVLADNSLMDGKPSHLLASFDVKGKPYEAVTYPANNCTIPAARFAKPLQYVQAINIRVCDKNGTLIDFQGGVVNFVLEVTS